MWGEDGKTIVSRFETAIGWWKVESKNQLFFFYYIMKEIWYTDINTTSCICCVKEMVLILETPYVTDEHMNLP